MLVDPGHTHELSASLSSAPFQTKEVKRQGYVDCRQRQ